MKRFPSDIIYLYGCVHSHIIYDISLGIKRQNMSYVKSENRIDTCI